MGSKKRNYEKNPSSVNQVPVTLIHSVELGTRFGKGLQGEDKCLESYGRGNRL